MTLQIAAVGAVSPVEEPHPVRVPTVPPPPDVANISPFGDLIGKLRELSLNGPGAIRDTLVELQHLVAAAAPQTAGLTHDELVDLTRRLGDAASSGDVAPLQRASIASSPRAEATAALLSAHLDALRVSPPPR